MARNLFDEFGIDPATLEQPTAAKRDLFSEFDIDPKSLVDEAPIRAEMRRLNPSATDAEIDYLTNDKVSEQAKPRQTTEENIQERVANRKKAGASQMGAEQATVFDLNLEQELTRRQNGLPAQVRGDVGALQREDWRKQQVQAAKDRKPPEDNRGLLGRAGDIGLGVVQGGQDVVKIFGDIYGLATGDTDNAVSEFGKKSSDFFQSKMSQYQQYMTKADAARLEQIGKDSGLGAQFVAGLYQSVTDPVAFARNAPLMLAGGLGGTATKAAVSTFLKTATEGTLVGIGTAGGVATGAAMQGADIGGDAYERLMNLPQEKWDANKEYRAALMEYSDKAAAKHAVALGLAREAALKAGAISIAANMLPMGDSLERVMAGGKLSGGMAARVAGAGLGEMGSEGLEEGGGKKFANEAVAYIDPTQRSMEGVGVAAGLGAGTGGLMGGAAGAMGGVRPQAEPAPAPRTPTVADIMAPEATVDDAITAAQEMVSAPTDTETSDMVKQAMDNISQLTDGDVITGDDGTEFTFQQAGPGQMPSLLDADGVPLPDELAAPLLSSTDALQGALARRVQPQETLDGRTDVGGQDAAMAAQSDEGASVDVPGSGTDTQAGLLGGLAGGSGSTGVMATPAGVDSVAGDAGVPGVVETTPTTGDTVAPKFEELPTQESQTQSPQVASEGAVKEPWQMTQDEYVRGNGFDLSPHAKLTGLKESPWQADDVSRATMTHKFQHILPAIEAGKVIPPEVLAEYPDLQEKAKAQGTPSVVVTPAQQKVVDAVNASLVDEQAKLGDKAPPLQQLTVATPEQMTPAVRDALPGVVAALRDLGYKGEVVVVASKNGTPLDFDGVVSSNGKGIVIAADSARPVAFVLGHEFLHELEKEAPDVYKVLADAILANSSEAKVVEHLQKRGYLDAKATAKDVTMPMRAEFVNDTFADMINNPKQGPLILLETAKNMDKADPGSGKDFLTRLNEFIKRVIKGMVGKGYGTEAAINKSELGAIRKAIAKALTDYNLQAKKAEKAKAAAEAAKAKQEAEAAKKAALAAEVARAKAKPVADEMTEDARAKLLERKQMLEDMIATKKEMRQVVPQHYITGLAEVSAKLRGETVDTEAIYSNEVEGHPMFDGSPILRNLIPIKVVNAESAEKSLYRAQDLYKQIVGERAKANHALSIAKTAAQKKAAETALKKLDNTGATQDALDTLREVTLPELARLSKEADAKFGPVEVAPPTDTKTDEVSAADGAKTDAASADGVNDNERLLREMATATEKPGDVLLTNGKYVPFDVVVRMAKDGIASGAFRAAPAQLHFNLDMAMRDVDRVLAAALADGPKRSLRNAAVDELNAKLLEQEGIENAFVPSEMGDPGIIDAFKKVFNVEIVPIAGRMDFLGMQFNGRLYVNAEHPNAGFVHIAGHELLHDLARKQPGIYAAFESEARNFSLRDAVPAYARRLGAAGGSQETDTYQEILADFVGEALTDPSFLQQMADANPTKFRMFVNAVTKWLDKVAEKLKFYDLHASDYFKEVKGLREYLVDVLDAYSDTQTLPEYTGIKRSLRNTITIDGQERPTTNSNGKPIAQTEEGLRNFWKWFGDSKVVDADGRPLVVYHGTDADFTVFKGKRGAHLGFHFGDKEAANTRLEDTADGKVDDAGVKAQNAVAEGYFNEWKAYEESLRRKDGEVPTDELMAALDAGEDIGPIFDKYKYQPTTEESAELLRLRVRWDRARMPIFKTAVGASIGAFYLQINKPLRMRDVGAWGVVKEVKAALPWGSDARSLGQIVEEIQSRGYDGIVYENRVETPVMRTDSYIAFSPTQIKSAIGNDGGFDGMNPDIRRSNRDTDAELARKLAHALAGYEQRLQPAFEQALNENQAKSDELKRFIVPHADSERVGEELARETGIGVEQITEMLQGGPIEVNGEMMHPVEVISTAMSLVRVNMAQLVDAETADDMTQKMTDTMNLMLSLRANISEVARALSFVGYAERKGGAKGFEIAAQADGKPEVQAADKVAKDAEKAATEAEADAIKAIDDLTKKDGGAFKETEAAEQAERDATDKDNEATDVEQAATDKKQEAKKKREAEKLAKERAKNTTGKAQVDAEAEAALSGQEANEAELKALAFETHAKNLRREAGKKRSEAKAARKRAEAALVKGRLLKQDAEVWAADAKRKMDRARKLRAEAIAQKKEAMRVRAQAQRLIAKSHSAIVNAKMQADKANREVKKMRYSLTKERILEAMGGEAEMQKIFDELKRQGHDVNMHGVIMLFQGMAGQQLKKMKVDEAQNAGPVSKTFAKMNNISGMAAELFKAYILSRFSTHALNVVSTWVHRGLEMRITSTLAEMMPGGAGAKKHWQVMRALTGVSASAITAAEFAMHAESRAAQMIALLKMSTRDQKMVIDLTNNKWMDNQDRYLPGTFGKYVRNMGFTPLGMEDAYLKTFPYLYSLALQEAEGRVPDYQEAVEYAETIAFQSHLSPIGKAVNSMIKKVPVLGTHIPFITTLDNLIMKSLQYTPGAGLVFVGLDQKGLENAKLTGDPMKIRRAIDLRNKSLARSIVGGMIGALTILAYGNDDDDEDKGLMGLRPTDPNEFAIWRQENGVLAFGFAGHNISLERFDPLSSSVGLTIAAINATRAATDGDDSTSGFQELSKGAYQMLIAKTFFEPFMEMLLSFKDERRAEKGAVNYYANLLSAMTIPGAIAQFAELPDDLNRETKPVKGSKSPFTDAYLNKTAAKIPGLRDNLDPALDVWGEAADNPGYLNPSPVRPVKPRPDPLNNWLLKMGKTIHARPDSLEGIPFEKKQELLRKRHDMLTRLMSTTSGMDPEEKKDEVSRTIGDWTRTYVKPARRFYDLDKK